MPRNSLPQIYEVFREREAAWREHANCRGLNPDLFFAERGESVAEAKDVCRGCDSKEPCLDYAIATHQDFGVFGGMTERDRRREAKRRRRLRLAS